MPSGVFFGRLRTEPMASGGGPTRDAEKGRTFQVHLPVVNFKQNNSAGPQGF